VTGPAGDRLPPFQILANASGLLTPEEMDGLIAEHASLQDKGLLGAGGVDPKIRRSRVALLKPDERHGWLYRRIWEGAGDMNRACFNVEVDSIGAVQIACYHADDEGHYDWHLDFSNLAPRRKISISVQLSDPADYEGGDLEFSLGDGFYKGEAARGTVIAFPSFVLHRVTPVTRGVRWSLVAWITGPRWR